MAVLATGGWFIYDHFRSDSGPAVSPGINYTPADGSAIAANKVVVDNYTFSPADIEIKKGSSVTWTNKDFVGVTITEYDDKPGPASEALRQDQTYSYKFNTTGLFHYHNSFNPNMRGTVTVTQ